MKDQTHDNDIINIYLFKNARYLDSVDFFGISNNPLTIMKKDELINLVSFYSKGECIDRNEIMKKGPNDKVLIYKVSGYCSNNKSTTYYKYFVVNDINEIEKLTNINNVYEIKHIGDARVYKSPEEIDAEIERMRIG